MPQYNNKREYEPDDRGYIAKNEERTSDQAPSHKGKITLTGATLKALMAEYKDTGKSVIWLAVWPGKEKGMMSVKGEASQKYRDGATEERRPAAQRGQSAGRGAPQQRRQAPQQYDNDEEDFDSEIPF